MLIINLFCILIYPAVFSSMESVLWCWDSLKEILADCEGTYSLHISIHVTKYKNISKEDLDTKALRDLVSKSDAQVLDEDDLIADRCLIPGVSRPLRLRQCIRLGRPDWKKYLVSFDAQSFDTHCINNVKVFACGSKSLYESIEKAISDHNGRYNIDLELSRENYE